MDAHMLAHLLTIIAVSLAVSTVCLTVTKATIFGWFRRWLEERRSSNFVRALFDCPYCLGHWAALPATLVVEPWTFGFWRHGKTLIGIVVTWLAITYLAGLFSGILYRVYAGKIE